MAKRSDYDSMMDTIAIGAAFDASMAAFDRASQLYHAANTLLAQHCGCWRCPGYQIMEREKERIADCMQAGNAFNDAVFDALDCAYFPKLLTA